MQSEMKSLARVEGWIADLANPAGDHTCGKTSHFITPVKKNVLGPSEAYTEEEYICQRRGSSGFSVQVFAYTRKVSKLTQLNNARCVSLLLLMQIQASCLTQ